MWEEEPWYQKQQAKIIGVLLLTILIVYSICFIAYGDWDGLKEIWLLTAAFIFVSALLVGSVWAFLKIFVPQREDETEVENKHE